MEWKHSGLQRSKKPEVLNSAREKMASVFQDYKSHVGRLHITGNSNNCRRVLHETGMVKNCNLVQLPVVPTKEFASAKRSAAPV
jgi:hypothetical protein